MIATLFRMLKAWPGQTLDKIFLTAKGPGGCRARRSRACARRHRLRNCGSSSRARDKAAEHRQASRRVVSARQGLL
jgi:hypothetical protein